MENITRRICPWDKSYFFGLIPFYSHVISETEWAHIRELGIKSLRIHLQKGYDWKDYDIVLESAAREGIEVMMLVSYESFGSLHEPFNKGWGPIMHFTNAMELVDELEKAVPYFKGKGVTSWEIWNEQNGMWHLHPDEYAELLTTIYRKFKYTDKWDPEATIVFGGLDAVNVYFPKGVNGEAKAWMEELYATDAFVSFRNEYGHPPFDVMAIHPYNTIDLDDNMEVAFNDVETGLKGIILDLMDRHDDDNIPVWITELGDQDEDDERNARKLELYVKTLYNMPRITRLHWFKYTYPGDEGHGLYSLVMEKGRVRKSLNSYKKIIEELNS